MGILSLSNKVPRNSILPITSEFLNILSPQYKFECSSKHIPGKGHAEGFQNQTEALFGAIYSEALQSKVFCKHCNIFVLVKGGAPGLLGTGFSHHSKSQEIRDCSETIGQKKKKNFLKMLAFTLTSFIGSKSTEKNIIR